MSGFAYDGQNYDGGHWDEETTPTSMYLADESYDRAHWDQDPASGQYWLIDDLRIRVTGVTLTPTNLDLDIRARTNTEQRALEILDSNAGAYDQRERADGTLEALDTAGGGNTFTVRPPTLLSHRELNASGSLTMLRGRAPPRTSRPSRQPSRSLPQSHVHRFCR